MAYLDTRRKQRLEKRLNLVIDPTKDKVLLANLGLFSKSAKTRINYLGLEPEPKSTEAKVI